MNALRVRLDALRDWFLRIWYCHHNARVLADMEWRLSCVLTECTSTMSKPYYSIEAMRAEIHAYIEERCDEAYREGQEDCNCQEDTE